MDGESGVPLAAYHRKDLPRIITLRESSNYTREGVPQANHRFCHKHLGGGDLPAELNVVEVQQHCGSAWGIWRGQADDLQAERAWRATGPRDVICGEPN